MRLVWGKKTMDNHSVLVLNQNYVPLNICQTRRAIVLVWQGKAEVLENGLGFIRTAAMAFQISSVIRLLYLIKRPRPQPKLTRREIFVRDSYTCQYCGRQTRDLTLDHVMPRYLGGSHSWENLVSACIPCNRRKAGRTPAEARMKLLKQPFRPVFSGYQLVYQHARRREEWLKYVPEWEMEQTRA